MKININESQSVLKILAAGAPSNIQSTFPPLPPIPGDNNPNNPSNWPTWDPTNDPNWPQDADNVNGTFNGQNYMEVLANAVTYVVTHPGQPLGYMVLTRIVYRLATTTAPDGQTYLTKAEGQLQAYGIDPSTFATTLANAIDMASEFGFLYGYPTQYPGGTTPNDPGVLAANYSAFATALLAVLPNDPSDPLIQAMRDECTKITAPGYALSFVGQHQYSGSGGTDAFGNTMQAGDIIYQISENGVLVTYDWSAAIRNEASPSTSFTGGSTTLQAITYFIENADGAAGGPNPSNSTLSAILHQLQTQDLLNTFEEVLSETGDVGMAILAFMEEAGLYQNNASLSGPADVMDQEKSFSQLAQQIENDLKEIGGSGGISPQQAQEIAANTVTLFQEILGNGQFSEGLSTAVQSAISTFEGTNITYTYPAPPTPGGTSYTQSVWQLLTGAASGSISSAQLASALQQGLAPAPPSSPVTGPTPPDSGATALQGILGGFDGLITAVSSNSSAEVTTSQQGESLITAMTKVMTGVTDKTQGINTGVIGNTIKNQISS